MTFKVTYCTFQVFNVRYLEMRKLQGANYAISKLMYGSCVCTDDKLSLKLVAYRLVHTDEPYINLHYFDVSSINAKISNKICVNEKPAIFN